MNEIIELYFAKARNYLNDADLLIENKSSESSVSRAYYAMFYAVKALLFSIEIETKTHQGTIMIFYKKWYFREEVW